jgi:hypothetical protein
MTKTIKVNIEKSADNRAVVDLVCNCKISRGIVYYIDNVLFNGNLKYVDSIELSIDGVLFDKIIHPSYFTDYTDHTNCTGYVIPFDTINKRIPVGDKDIQIHFTFDDSTTINDIHNMYISYNISAEHTTRMRHVHNIMTTKPVINNKLTPGNLRYIIMSSSEQIDTVLINNLTYDTHKISTINNRNMYRVNLSGNMIYYTDIIPCVDSGDIVMYSMYDNVITHKNSMSTLKYAI